MCSLYMCSLNKLGRPSGQKKVPIKKKRHLSEPSEVRVTDDVGRSFGEAITCVKMCVYVRERERERERVPPRRHHAALSNGDPSLP